MKKKVEGRKVINLIYIIAMLAVVFSCFFANRLSVLLYLKPDYSFDNKTEIHFIDVGQGDAIGIKFDNGKTMLIDTGTVEYRNKLKYYLNNVFLENTKRIDYIVLTHIDTDHSGNMLFLLDNYEIGKIYRPKIYSTSEDLTSINTSYWYNEIIDCCLRKEIPMEFNESGVNLIEGFSKLTWLSPINLSHNEIIESNDFSTFIKLESGDFSALFTGDASIAEENKLIEEYPLDMLDVDILKMAHHGSHNSTSENLLIATTPQYACISVGENTYGHPSNKLLDRILQYDTNTSSNLYSNLYTTINDGNVIFTLSDCIDVMCIENIDNYSFVSYFLYAFLLIVILGIFIFKPYYKVWKKNLRFNIQNKKFKQYLESENERQKTS